RLHDLRMRGSDLEQDSAYLNRIAAVSHGDFDHDAAQGVGARPIFDHAGDEFGIWNDDARPVEGLDLSSAHTDASHPSFLTFDDDGVPEADRPLGQQDETGDEVRHDGL